MLAVLRGTLGRSGAIASDGGPRGPFHGKTPLTSALRLQHAKIAWCLVTQTLANVSAIWQQGADHNSVGIEGENLCHEGSGDVSVNSRPHSLCRRLVCKSLCADSVACNCHWSCHAYLYMKLCPAYNTSFTPSEKVNVLSSSSMNVTLTTARVSFCIEHRSICGTAVACFPRRRRFAPPELPHMGGRSSGVVRRGTRGECT